MPTEKFTEAEVRLAYLIALATGHTINEINTKIIDVTIPTKRDKDGSPLPDSSRLASLLAKLRELGCVGK